MSLARRATRNMIAQGAGLAVTFLERVLLTGVLIRHWGVDTFSDWTTLVSAATMLAIADFGFQTFLGNMLTSARVRGRARALERLVSLGITFYLILALVLLTAVAGVALFGNVRALFGLHGSDLGPVLMILGAQQILRIARGSVTQIYRAMNHFHLFAWTEVRTLGSSALLASLIVAFGASPLEASLVYLGVELLLGVGFAIVDVRRRFPSIRLRWRRVSLKRVAGTAITLRWWALYFGLYNLMLNMPVLIVAWFGLGGMVLATFAVQRTLTNVARTVSYNLQLAIGVELATAVQEPGRPGFMAGMETLARANAALGALVSASLLAFGPAIVRIWTGRADLGSLPVLIWLLVPIIAVAPAVPVQMVALYTGRVREQTIAVLVQALIALPLAFAGSALFGIAGIAAALALGEIVGVCIVVPALTVRALNIDYWRLVRSAALVFLLSASWAGLVAFGTLSLVPSTATLGLLVQLSAWGAVGACPVLWFALPGAVRAKILGAISRKLGPRVGRR